MGTAVLRSPGAAHMTRFHPAVPSAPGFLSHRYSGDHPILSEGPISRGLGHISRARPFCLPLGAVHRERESPADVWSLRVPWFVGGELVRTCVSIPGVGRMCSAPHGVARCGPGLARRPEPSLMWRASPRRGRPPKFPPRGLVGPSRQPLERRVGGSILHRH